MSAENKHDDGMMARMHDISLVPNTQGDKRTKKITHIEGVKASTCQTKVLLYPWHKKSSKRPEERIKKMTRFAGRHNGKQNGVATWCLKSALGLMGSSLLLFKLIKYCKNVSLIQTALIV